MLYPFKRNILTFLLKTSNVFIYIAIFNIWKEIVLYKYNFLNRLNSHKKPLSLILSNKEVDDLVKNSIIQSDKTLNKFLKEYHNLKKCQIALNIENTRNTTHVPSRLELYLLFSINQCNDILIKNREERNKLMGEPLKLKLPF